MFEGTCDQRVGFDVVGEERLDLRPQLRITGTGIVQESRPGIRRQLRCPDKERFHLIPDIRIQRYTLLCELSNILAMCAGAKDYVWYFSRVRGLYAQ